MIIIIIIILFRKTRKTRKNGKNCNLELGEKLGKKLPYHRCSRGWGETSRKRGVRYWFFPKNPRAGAGRNENAQKVQKPWDDKMAWAGKTGSWNWPKSGVKKLPYHRCSRGLGETTRERVCRAVFVRRIRKKGWWGPKKWKSKKTFFFPGPKSPKIRGLDGCARPVNAFKQYLPVLGGTRLNSI